MTSDDIGLPQSPAQAAEGDLRKPVAWRWHAYTEDQRRRLGEPLPRDWIVTSTEPDEHALRDAAKGLITIEPLYTAAALSAEGSATIAAAQLPEDPTQEMVQAGLEAYKTQNSVDWSLNGKVARIYRAMLAAVPPLPPSSSPEDQQKAAVTPTIADPDGEANHG